MGCQVSVIQDEADRFYIGLSEDISKRLQDHNSGVTKWTKGKGPWKLVWQSEVLSLRKASKLENGLKRHNGGEEFFRQTGLGVLPSQRKQIVW